MDIIEKELQSREAEIKKAIDLLFKANMKITDWDVPEGDDHESATIIVKMMQEALDTIKEDISAGTYDYY